MVAWLTIMVVECGGRDSQPHDRQTDRQEGKRGSWEEEAKDKIRALDSPPSPLPKVFSNSQNNASSWENNGLLSSRASPSFILRESSVR